MKRQLQEKGLIKVLLKKAGQKVSSPVTLMEVCGTHTFAFFTSGIKKMLPPKIRLISGPGCPVCVTEDEDIEKILTMARRPEVIVATFGDMLRVPGFSGSLETARAEGAWVEIIYSPLWALELAQKNPDKKIIFLAVGFETTAPAIGQTILEAEKKNIKNFFIFPLLKTIPEVLEKLFETRPKIDGLILPGHVSTIIGGRAYRNFVKKFSVPSVIAGFEPLDLAEAVYELLEMIAQGRPGLKIQYTRAVSENGNLKAQKIMEKVFQKTAAAWRGLGVVPKSGLDLKKEFANFDARQFFPVKINRPKNSKKKFCLCGLVLQGRKIPPDCRLFGKRCTPENPVGPCMVSSEGACAAYYKYGK